MAAKQVAKPHIAFLPSPGIGHLIPFLEFAKHLVIHHNVHVSFLVINTDENPMMQHQILHSPTLPSGLHVIDLPKANFSSCDNDNKTVLSRINHSCQESIKHLGKTLTQLNFPKALIIDMFTTDALFVCKELGIPVYSFYTTTTKNLAWTFYLTKLHKECGRVDLTNPIQLPGCKPIAIDDFPDELVNRKDDQESEGIMRHLSRLTMVAGIFVNTWDDLESKSCWLKTIKNDAFFKTLPAPPIYVVGPLIKRDEAVAKSDDYIISWLNKQSTNSVLLVSLGSGGTLTTEQLNELALGLEMSEQKFVWVVRKPNDFSSSGTFFNEEGDRNTPLSYLPEGFVKRTAGRGLVVPSWAPQVPILGHEATGGFLSHCGWNSALESIVHGVPMIAWPLYAEQKMNATSLTEEIAIAVKPIAVSSGEAGGQKIVKREEVERVVRLLMESEQGMVMRGKAIHELKETAAKAMKSGGSSYDLISSVVGSWK